MAPCLAESWTESEDGLVYEFKLREGLRFHNGDAFTAEDVKFTFHRYRGASAKLLHGRVKAVEIVDPYRVRFVLHTLWSDFLVVLCHPGNWRGVDRAQAVHREGWRGGLQASSGGARALSVLADESGVELVLDANEQYWRKKPSINRVIFKGFPDRTTRLAMLKTGEADIGYLMVGLEARPSRQTPNCAWPCHPARGVVAGIPRAVESQVAMARPARPTGSYAGGRQAHPQRRGTAWVVTPDGLDHPERHGVRAPHRALSLRPYAGETPPCRRRVPEWFRRRRPHPAASVHDHGRGRCERPCQGWYSHACAQYGASDLHGGVAVQEAERGHGYRLGGAGQHGRAPRVVRHQRRAVRIRRVSRHRRSIPEQAQERDRTKREALLHRIQQLMHERVMHGPIFEPATLHGVGPRVEEAAIGLNSQLYFAAPYEEMRLRKP